MAGEFDGQVALVSGGNSGIGKATAIAFARDGAKVVVAARRQVEGEQTVAEIKEAGGEAIFVKTDVSKRDQIEAMVTKTVEAYGRLDHAFNNAGRGGGGPIHTCDEATWDGVMEVNLTSVFLSMKYELQQMLAQGTGGCIVNNSSVAGLIGVTDWSAYNVSKFGVVGLTKCGALTYGSKGIRVNAVCPGFIDTKMLRDGINGGFFNEQKLHAAQPIPRMGLPAEVAEVVVWLCSSKSRYVSGEVMAVDGGLMAGRYMGRDFGNR